MHRPITLAPLLAALLAAGCYQFDQPDPPEADDDDAAPDDDDIAPDDDDIAPDDDDIAPDDDDIAPDDDDIAPDDDDIADDDDTTPDPLDGLSPAHVWIRTNPLFISGLSVSMDPPAAATVDTYFDDFGATAVHTWADGLPNRIAGWEAAGHSDFAYLSWVDSSGASADGGAVIGGVGAGSPGRIGFQVGDEPRNLADVADIAAGTQAVLAADPDALIVVNFGNPEEGTALADILDEAVTTVDLDIVSYDYYSTGYAELERMSIIREFALDHGLPYWRYLRSYDDLGQSDWPEATDLRWDAMLGVVQGFTGATWFVYQVHPMHNLAPAFFDGGGDWSSSQTARFDQAAELNGELEILGQVLPWLTSTDVRYTPGTSLYAPDGLSAWSAGAGGDPYITSVEPVGLDSWEVQDVHIGFFEDADGELYVALQNPTHASADWPVMVSDDATFEVRFDFATAPSALAQDQLLVLDHHSGSVVGQPLTLDGERVLTITLDAGDLVFFKYDTGAGFAGLEP